MEKPSSRLLGKAVDKHREREKEEKSNEKITELYVDMRLIQRDSPETQWHIGDIHSDRDIVIIRDPRGASVSKNTQKLLEELNTPGSPWSRRT